MDFKTYLFLAFLVGNVYMFLFDKLYESKKVPAWLRYIITTFVLIAGLESINALYILKGIANV